MKTCSAVGWSITTTESVSDCAGKKTSSESSGLQNARNKANPAFPMQVALRYYWGDSVTLRKSAALLTLTLLAACGGSQKTKKDTAYIGPPGSVPKVAGLPRSAYGAWTFESPLNFCRGVRWILSGKMAPQWPDEPEPVFVKRGTAIEILQRQQVECGELDQTLALVNGALVQYRQMDGSDSRYALESDVYTPEQYREYAGHKKAARMNAVVKSQALPRVNVPPMLWTKGYEGGLSDLFKVGDAGLYLAGKLHGYPMSCNLAMAARYADAARAAFAGQRYNVVRMYAYGVEHYTETCARSQHPARLEGDGLLLLSKAELRLNMLTAGKNDADAAAAAFLDCDADDGYDDDSVQYCLERRLEAEGIVKNG